MMIVVLTMLLVLVVSVVLVELKVHIHSVMPISTVDRVALLLLIVREDLIVVVGRISVVRIHIALLLYHHLLLGVRV